MYDRRHLRMLARQILAKTRNSTNSPNIIARQNFLIYSIWHLISCLWLFQSYAIMLRRHDSVSTLNFLWLRLQVLIRANCLNISSMFLSWFRAPLMSFRRCILFPLVHIVMHGFLNLFCNCVFVTCNAVAWTKTVAFEEFGVLYSLPQCISSRSLYDKKN